MQKSIDSRWRIVRFAGESNSSEPNNDVLAIEGELKRHEKSTCVVT